MILGPSVDGKELEFKMAAWRACFRKATDFVGPIRRFYVTDDVPWKNAPPSMEKCINQVVLLGRVGTEPQSRGSQENPVTIFTMATNTTYKDESGDFKQRTEWHRISVFKPSLRDNVYNFLRKGQRCFVQGKIGYGQVTEPSGITRSTTSVFADEVIFFPKESGIEAEQSAFVAEEREL